MILVEDSQHWTDNAKMSKLSLGETVTLEVPALSNMLQGVVCPVFEAAPLQFTLCTTRSDKEMAKSH